MAFIPTPDGAKLVMPFSGEGKTWSNTLWFTKHLFDSADMVLLADTVQYCFYAAFDSLFGSAVQYGPPVVYDMRTEDGEIAYGTDDPEGGEATGDLLTPATALCLTLRTAARGKSGRGRIYLGGFTESNIGTGGAFSGTLVTAANGFVTCMLENIPTTGWNWVVRSIQQAGVVLAEAICREIISGEVRKAQSASQRRRNQRG
jgi:hypothetical protein